MRDASRRPPEALAIADVNAMGLDTDDSGRDAGRALPGPLAGSGFGADMARAADALDKTCSDCGTQIPRREDRCAVCQRLADRRTGSGRSTLANWCIMLALMGLILGGGILLAP